jgi:transcriptional regulator with XRE-family HTH domain
MKNKTGLSAKLLNEPSYWIEEINGMLYDAILVYMQEKKFNKTQLAVDLGISKKQASQLLNGEGNDFSLEKILEISLTVGKFPVFTLEDKEEYLNKKKVD